MSDTPETDQFVKSFREDCWPNHDEWLSLCQRLERERDEASATVNRYRNAILNAAGVIIEGGIESRGVVDTKDTERETKPPKEDNDRGDLTRSH